MPSTSWQRVQRAGSRLSALSVQAMEQLPWFRALPAGQRSYVGLVVQAGLETFAQWLRHPERPLPTGPEVFAAAPRELARAVSLKQTVQLIRTVVDVVESEVASLASPGDEQALRGAVLRYSREIAFAAADVYAAAAEARGAWDARVEAGVVDALVRGHDDELTLSRAASLGWSRGDWVVPLTTPASGSAGLDLSQVGASLRPAGLSLLTGEASGALIFIVGGAGELRPALEHVVRALPDGPVIQGPVVAELSLASPPLQEALAGLAAVAAWPQAPRPVTSGQLLAERVLLGDEVARRRLLEEIYIPLAAAGGDLLLTAAVFLDGGGSVEGAARTLFLHANTVRYRLRKVTDLVGYDLTRPRDALVVRLAVLLGRTTRL